MFDYFICEVHWLLIESGQTFFILITEFQHIFHTNNVWCPWQALLEDKTTSPRNSITYYKTKSLMSYVSVSRNNFEIAPKLQHKLKWSVHGITIIMHSASLVFPTQTKKSMDFLTFILQVYIRKIRISWKNHLSSLIRLPKFTSIKMAEKCHQCLSFTIENPFFENCCFGRLMTNVFFNWFWSFLCIPAI